MDPLLIVAIVCGALLFGSFAPGAIDKIKTKLFGKPADPAAPKAGLNASLDEISAKIKALLDQTGIPQTLENIKQFAEVGIALAGIDGVRKLVGDVVATDRLPAVEAALDSVRTEVASSLLTPAK